MPTAPTRRPLAEPLEQRRLFAVVAGFTEAPFVTGLDNPTAMDFAPDGRLFVAEQGGTLRVVKNGTLLDAPFVSLDVNAVGERGLLGVTFDPAFAANGFVYVYYTSKEGNTHNRVSRFTAAGDVAAAGSERVLLDLPELTVSNHNGGAVHFGPDGKLYVGVGENANRGLSQTLESPLGKMLRINADGSIPGDNPFVDRTTGINQSIWAMGLRNPFTFAFDPATGRMHINDVGNQSFEEINVGKAGANYGWSLIEGKRTTETPPADYVDPFFAYPRDGGPVSGVSVAGGAFYRAASGAAAAFPARYAGDYFFADFGSGFVKSIDTTTGAVSDFASDLSSPVDVRVGSDGKVYALEHAGRVSVFAPTVGTNPDPDPTPDPDPSDPIAPTAALSAALSAEPPATAVQGDRGRMTVRVGNATDATVRGRVTVRLLASVDGAADAGDAVLAEAERTVKLKAGRDRAFKFKFTYPDSLAGTVRLVAQVEPGAGIAETNATEAAVASGGAVTVSPRTVDLSATFREPTPKSFRIDRRGSLVLDLTNAGNTTFSGRVNLLFRASADPAADDGDAVLRDASPKVKIAPGQTRGVRLRFRPPADLPVAGYFVVADLDRLNAIAETDEANNQTVSPTAIPFT